MHGDGQHEEGAGHVAGLDYPALREAGAVGAGALALVGPMEGDDEAERLEKIGKNQLMYEHDALVTAYEAAIVRAAGNNVPADEGK